MKELTERGLQLFSELRSSERAASMRQLIEDNAFGSALANVAVDSVFASIWTREGLERKQRSLVTIGILIALRQTAASAEKFLRSRRNNLNFVREDRSSGGHHRRPDCITGNTLRYRVHRVRLHHRHAASPHGQAVFASRASAAAAALPTGFFSAALAIPNETAFPTAFSVTPFFTAFLTAISTFFAAFFLALSFAISKYLGVLLVPQLEIVQGRRFFDVFPAAAEVAQSGTPHSYCRRRPAFFAAVFLVAFLVTVFFVAFFGDDFLADFFVTSFFAVFL